MIEQELIYAYEQMLLGKKKVFSANAFIKNGKKDMDNDFTEDTKKNSLVNQKKALVVIKYAFENMLHYSPNEVKNLINKNLLDKMKLTNFLEYLQFPPELDKNTDFFYIAYLLYPNKFRYNAKEFCIYTYKKMLNKEIDKLPKGFFLYNEGELRAILCFQYIINNEISFDNIKDYYEFFNTTSGNKFLRDYRLMTACDLHFKNSLHFAHRALPIAQRNDFLYNFYEFYSKLKKINNKQ